MRKEFIENIEFNISEIDLLFHEYDSFLKDMNYCNPDLIQMTVMGHIIESFYTGVEGIFENLIKEIDGFVPKSSKSHQDLLNNIYDKAVINEDTYLTLSEYLKFRHVFRYSYSFKLKWGKFKPLAEILLTTWDKVKEQIIAFINR